MIEGGWCSNHGFMVVYCDIYIYIFHFYLLVHSNRLVFFGIIPWEYNARLDFIQPSGLPKTKNTPETFMCKFGGLNLHKIIGNAKNPTQPNMIPKNGIPNSSSHQNSCSNPPLRL